MRLLNHLLHERLDTVMLDLSLAEIIKAGKMTNGYHTVLLSNMAKSMPDCFKEAFGHTCECADNEVELVKFLKEAPDQKIVKFAQLCMECLKPYNGASPVGIGMVDWMANVIHRQD